MSKMCIRHEATYVRWLWNLDGWTGIGRQERLQQLCWVCLRRKMEESTSQIGCRLAVRWARRWLCHRWICWHEHRVAMWRLLRLVGLLMARLWWWGDAKVPVVKSMCWCWLELFYLLRSIETPTPCDYVEFQISLHRNSLFFLPTTLSTRLFLSSQCMLSSFFVHVLHTHSPLCLLISSLCVDRFSLIFVGVLTPPPPLSSCFQFVHAFICLCPCSSYSHPIASSSPGSADYWLSSICMSVCTFVLPHLDLLYSHPPFLSSSPGSGLSFSFIGIHCTHTLLSLLSRKLVL